MRSGRWRTVALPTEHGGWGFISEPLLLGLLLGFSWGGLALGIGAMSAFLMRQPLKLYLKDKQQGRTVPRTAIAWRFVLIYGGVMTVSAALVLWQMPSVWVVVPLALMSPLIGLQLWHDVYGSSRALVPELAGAFAAGGFAAAILMMAGGWTLAASLWVWLVLALKSVSAVLYVRSRLRLERDKPADRPLAIGAHGASLIALLVMSTSGVTTWVAPLGMVILTGRATLGLSGWRTVRPAKAIGMQEVGYGLGYVLLIVAGYSLRMAV